MWGCGGVAWRCGGVGVWHGGVVVWGCGGVVMWGGYLTIPSTSTASNLLSSFLPTISSLSLSHPFFHPFRFTSTPHIPLHFFPSHLNPPTSSHHFTPPAADLQQRGAQHPGFGAGLGQPHERRHRQGTGRRIRHRHPL